MQVVPVSQIRIPELDLRSRTLISGALPSISVQQGSYSVLEAKFSRILRCNNGGICHLAENRCDFNDDQASEALIEGSEALIEGSEALIEGSEALIEGSEAPIEGSEAPIEGSEALIEGSEAPIESSRRRIDDSRATIQPRSRTTDDPSRSIPSEVWRGDVRNR